MSLYFRAQILFVCLCALVGGGLWIKKTVHNSHSLPVTAAVSMIDRKCEWKDGNTGEVRRLPCSHDEVEGGYKKTDEGVHYLVGDAVIHFAYAAPQDGIERPGEFKIDGKDPRFYSLKAGDPLPVRVSKDDPALYEVE